MISESSNMKMHYSCLYFKDQNRELLEHDFCSKISIHKDRVLLEMLLSSLEIRVYISFEGILSTKRSELF